MRNQMKKAVSMLLSLAIVVTSVPMQPVMAEDEILIVDEEQDVGDAVPDEVVSMEPEVVIEEAQPVFDENNTEPLPEQISESEFFETEMTESNLPPENETDESETDIETQEISEEQISEDEFIIGEDSAEIEMIAVEELEALNLEEGEAAPTEETQNGEFTYTLLEDGTAEITGYTGEKSGDLVIPDVVDGYTVTSIGDHAFAYCRSFTGNLVLSESITNIGDYAFDGCSGFTGNLILPEGIISIGNGAFYNCNGFIGNLVLPSSLKSIGENIFGDTICILGYKQFVEEDNTQCINIKDGKLYKGEPAQLYICADSDGENELKLPSIWESSDSKIVSIDQQGNVTANETGKATITATSFDGLTATLELEVLDIDLNVGLYTAPGLDKLQDLWVGDSVLIGRKSDYDEGEYRQSEQNNNLKSVEIISGSQYITLEKPPIESDYGIGKYSNVWRVRCVQAGEVRIKVAYQDWCKKEPVELNLKIQERQKKVNIQFLEKIKLGEEWHISYENLPYGALPIMFIDKEDAKKFVHANVGWGGYGAYYTRRNVEVEYPTWHNLGTSMGGDTLIPAFSAIRPGTVTGTLYWTKEDCRNQINAQGEYQVEIEEPIIETNEKNGIVGDILTLEVLLENTAYKDRSVDENAPYNPQIEVLEGKECIDFQSNSQITTLSLKQTLKFVQAGTVKIKILYIPSEHMAVNAAYQPEKTITIQVNAKPVTATFNSNGGSKVVSQTVDSGTCIKEPAAPKKSGYVFCGWYLGSTKFDFKNPVTEDITLTAKWERQAVKVTSVNLNKTSLRLKKGQKQTLIATVEPANATNKALTWTTSNKKVATVSNGKITAVGYGTATITAKAADGSGKSASCKVKVGYGITYKLNGGKNNSANPAAYYKETVTLKNPTRKGYLFKGWYTDKKLKKKITKITKKTSKNLTLYAKWEKIKVGKTSISSLKNSGKRAMTVKFKQVSKAAGYEVLYSTNKKFSKNNGKIDTKKKSLTIKKLKAKTTYYVKVRAYRIDSTGKKVYGKYSTVKKIKIQK